MTILSKTQKIAILLAAALVALGAGYFYYSQKTAEPPANPAQEPRSLADDPEYVKEKIGKFLADNPKASEEYARNIVFHDIAVKEKDVSVCEKVKDAYWKAHCLRLLKN